MAIGREIEPAEPKWDMPLIVVHGNHYIAHAAGKFTMDISRVFYRVFRNPVQFKEGDICENIATPFSVIKRVSSRL